MLTITKTGMHNKAFHYSPGDKTFGEKVDYNKEIIKEVLPKHSTPRTSQAENLLFDEEGLFIATGPFSSQILSKQKYIRLIRMPSNKLHLANSVKELPDTILEAIKILNNNY